MQTNVTIKETIRKFRTTRNLNDIQNNFISSEEAEALTKIIQNITAGKYSELELQNFVGGNK